jgi:hypothetical protein
VVWFFKACKHVLLSSRFEQPFTSQTYFGESKPPKNPPTVRSNKYVLTSHIGVNRVLPMNLDESQGRVGNLGSRSETEKQPSWRTKDLRFVKCCVDQCSHADLSSTLAIRSCKASSGKFRQVHLLHPCFRSKGRPCICCVY